MEVRGVPVHLFFVVCYCFLFWVGWVSSGGWGLEVRGVPVHLFFVVCYCFLFWVGWVSFNSAIMKSNLFMFCRD